MSHVRGHPKWIITYIILKTFKNLKVLEVHEKSDLVPAPVHKEKIDCVPKSDHEIWQKSDLSSRSRSRSWNKITCFKSRVEVTNFDICQNISGMLNTFGCNILFY